MSDLLYFILGFFCGFFFFFLYGFLSFLFKRKNKIRPTSDKISGETIFQMPNYHAKRKSKLNLLFIPSKDDENIH
jgi:hypothetical protein